MASVKSMPLNEISDKIAWLDRMITHGDKRRHPRRPVKLKADFVIEIGQGVKKDNDGVSAGVIDMSISGAGVLTQRPMSCGQKFLLLCNLSKGNLKLSLEVVRHSKKDKLFHYGCMMHSCEKTA